MTIRQATAADRDLLVEIGRSTFFDTFDGTCPAEDMQLFLAESYAPDKVLREIESPQSYFYLLEEQNGAACGYARLAEEEKPPSFLPAQDGKAIELVRFYLRQSAIGSGAGQILMEHCLAEARRLGYRQIYLGVWEKNFRAQRFYGKYGFEKCGEKVFMVGRDAQTDWYMAREL